MWSRSERLRRLAAALLLAAVLLGAGLSYHAVTPIGGSEGAPPRSAASVAAATRWLKRASRPFDQTTLCRPLKAYAPDLVSPGEGGAPIDRAPRRSVILCEKGAQDYAEALARAEADGLNWRRDVAGTRLVVFARDEAAFHSAMAAAGLSQASVGPLRPSAPALLQALQSNAPGVVADEAGWRIPAHDDDRLLLFGPFTTLAGGTYGVNLHGRFATPTAQCPAARAAFHPTLAVTKDDGRAGVQGPAPAQVTPDAKDACAFTLSMGFALPEDGARRVETPFRAPSRSAFVIDGYAMAPAPAAQSQ